ncbi:uncharacterized protein [Miscanthus floridulus]|uniref:uncharacterized protein isoform X2 n=1 Tax=Miscanthus floridulus TaxID=154761 RepID=UPI003459BB8C
MDGGSGNASGGGASTCCYYALLGIRKNASATDIRSAYRRTRDGEFACCACARGGLAPVFDRLGSVCVFPPLLPNRPAHMFRSLAVGAQKWHPDRWASDPGAAGEAKRRFQRIQEAYSVLSDKGKKAMYDAGLFDPLDDDDQDFSDFMQEMLVMMDNVTNEPDTLEDLQKMLEDIVNGDGGGGVGGRMPPPPDGARRTRVAPYPQPQQARR